MVGQAGSAKPEKQQKSAAFLFALGPVVAMLCSMSF